MADMERRRWRKGGEKEGRTNSPQATTQPESEKVCVRVCICTRKGGGVGANRDRSGEGKDEREALASPDASPEEESTHSAIWSQGDS